MRGILLGAVVVLLGCASGPPTEPLPAVRAVDTSGLLPAIREEFERARRFAEENPGDARAWGEYAMLLHAHKKNSVAEACYQRAVRLRPDEFRWRYLLAHAQTALGRNEQAAETLKAALEIDPDYEPALVKLGDVLLDLGQIERAGRYYRQAAAKDPDDAYALFGLGRVETAQGDLDGAAESYARACELYEHYGAAHYALAITYRRLGRTLESKPHFALSEEYKTSFPLIRDRYIKELRRRDMGTIDLIRAALARDKQGKLDESLRMHLEALKIDPNLAQAHVNLISLYGRLGQPEKAEEHYHAAMKLNPDMADCHYNYGVLLFDQGRAEEAEDAFRRAIDINPFYAQAHNNLGYLLETQGKYADALQHYRKAIDNQPQMRLANFHLGRLLVNRRNYAEGIKYLRRTLIGEDEETPTFLYAIGAAYARSGDRANARRYLQQALGQAHRFRQDQLAASINKDLDLLR